MSIPPNQMFSTGSSQTFHENPNWQPPQNQISNTPNYIGVQPPQYNQPNVQPQVNTLNNANPQVTPQAINPGNMQPDALQQYISQYNTAMTPGGAQPGTSAFQNTPAYNLQFGQGAQQMWNSNPVTSLLQQPNVSLNDFLNSDAYKVQYGNNTATDPNERFQNDPGVQMAIKAGMPLLANSYAQKGLGASGPAANAVAQYMYNNYLGFTGNQGNLYNTELNNKFTQQQQNVATYLNQQNLLGNSFNNYQSQLAGLAGQGYGASNQQGQNAFTSGQNLANILSGYQYGTGNNLAQAGLGVNQNIASLLANQGVLNANGYLGTGAAMSNNMLMGSELGAQLANAQNASNAGTMNSGLGGLGALYGMQQMNGGASSYTGNPLAPFGGQM